MATITFTIPGEPVGAPRMTQRDRWQKRPCVIRYRAWKDSARQAANGMIPPVASIESLSWVAWFVPPASWSNKKKAAALGQLHRSRPDRDNIDKAVLDALFPEDSGIASGRIEKRWGNESRVEVEIRTIGEI